MSARHLRENPRPGTAPSPADAALPRAEEAEPGLSAGRLAYSVDEVARLTGLSRDLLYDQMRQGNLDYLKIGRRRLITRQHLEQFLAITPRPGPSPQRPGTRGADPVQAHMAGQASRPQAAPGAAWTAACPELPGPASSRPARTRGGRR